MASPPPRTSEIRRDAVFNRWVILSPARARRPSDFKSHSPAASPGPNPNPPSCPFCIGNERDCAPEIFRVPGGGGGAAWRVRVIENLYPALRRDVAPPSADQRCEIPGFGFHDVVIETPRHSVHLPDLSAAEVGEVLLAYKERTLQLARHGSIKYVQVFKNHGASAGASMSHSHSQIMGLPLVPPTVSARLGSMKECFDRTDDEKAVDLGGLLKLMLQKLSRQLNDPPLNFMIHTAPFELPPSCSPYTHWFLQIVPQLTVVGGFEIGSGCYINPVFPEDAAKVLREL